MRELEHIEAVALMEWVGWNSARLPELALLFHIPNGGERHAAVAAKLKAEGVKRGVPDYFLPVARGGFHGLWIELKAGANTATQEQRTWMVNLTLQGYRAQVCNGWQEAVTAIEKYLAMPMAKD